MSSANVIIVKLRNATFEQCKENVSLIFRTNNRKLKKPEVHFRREMKSSRDKDYWLIIGVALNLSAKNVPRRVLSCVAAAAAAEGLFPPARSWFAFQILGFFLHPPPWQLALSQRSRSLLTEIAVLDNRSLKLIFSVSPSNGAPSPVPSQWRVELLSEQPSRTTCKRWRILSLIMKQLIPISAVSCPLYANTTQLEFKRRK